jgi:DNA-binding MarR family transcriptional regulator
MAYWTADMKIEDVIVMKDIPDAHLKALLELIHTASKINHRQNKFFQRFGLSPQQYNILRILRGSHPKPHSIGTIRSRMLDQTPHTTRMLDKLEAHKWLYRQREVHDRRSIMVYITEAGLQLMCEIDKVLAENIQMMHGLESEEAAQLTFLLEKLRSRLPE